MTPPLIPGSYGEPEAEPGITCLHGRFGVPPEPVAAGLQEPLSKLLALREGAVVLVVTVGRHQGDGAIVASWVCDSTLPTGP